MKDDFFGNSTESLIQKSYNATVYARSPAQKWGTVIVTVETAKRHTARHSVAFPRRFERTARKWARIHTAPTACGPANRRPPHLRFRRTAQKWGSPTVVRATGSVIPSKSACVLFTTTPLVAVRIRSYKDVVHTLEPSRDDRADMRRAAWAPREPHIRPQRAAVRVGVPASARDRERSSGLRRLLSELSSGPVVGRRAVL